jgi:tetratricopeptide (TPR) repeat protein
MPLPLIPLILGAASLAAGAAGVKKGLDAKKIFDEAREIGQSAERRYRRKCDELEKRRVALNEELKNLGEFKIKVFEESLGYVVKQLRKARSSVSRFQEEITGIDLREVEVFETELKELSALEVGSGAAQGLAAGALTAFGAYGTVGMLATASTGTAISALSGAAATNATLAWLGGGNLAAGGLGVAGGSWVLGGLVAGPALAIAGFVLASKAEEALTAAKEYKAQVRTAIEEIEAVFVVLDAIHANIDECRGVLNRLLAAFAQAREAYERHLAANPKWTPEHDAHLTRLVALGKAIKEVVNEPLLDHDGSAARGFKTRVAGYAEVAGVT